MNTLSDGTTTIQLPDGLRWVDQHKWAAVGQSSERSITGKYLIDQMPKIGGRPITLQADHDRAGWARYSFIVQVQAWADIPGQELTLVFFGQTHTVLFRHEELAFEASPVVPFAYPENDDFFRFVLRLMVKA